MNQNNSPRKKKVFVAHSIKFMIAAASVAGTIGLWGAFSKQNVQTVQAEDPKTALPPLPTLMALNSVDTTSLRTTNSDGDPLGLLPVATQPPSRTTVSSGAIQIIELPVPVTQTRSSR